MKTGAIRWIGSIVVLAALGCAGGVPADDPRAGESATPARSGSSGAGRSQSTYVLEREELASDGRSVLSAMIGRVPNMRIDRSGRCPRISLRGSIIGEEATNPTVYIDGTRAMDTCLLMGIRAADLRRVEVYPTGVTTRAGYATNPHGLILLFRRQV